MKTVNLIDDKRFVANGDIVQFEYLIYAADWHGNPDDYEEWSFEDYIDIDIDKAREIVALFRDVFGDEVVK